MTPALAKTIDAARDLAWRPTSNLGGPRASQYEPRLESHRRVGDALAGVRGLSANASPELRFLLAAIRRVAAELRGCLVVYDRLIAASRPGRDFADVGSRGTTPRRRDRTAAPRAPEPLLSGVAP